MNNFLFFLSNACGNADCISSHEGHLCEECYKISKFCDDCRVHLINVLDMSNSIWWITLILAIILAFLAGLLLGSSD